MRGALRSCGGAPGRCADPEAAKEKGLTLPPVMESVVNEDEFDEEVKKPAESEVGKGLFDGW